MTGLFRFAKMTGFVASSSCFRKEYVAICRLSDVSPAGGIPFEVFQKLIDDESDEGQFVGSAVIKAMIRDLVEGRS